MFKLAFKVTLWTNLMLLIASLLLLSGCLKPPKTELLQQSQNANINPRFLSAQGQKADPNYTVNLPDDHQAHPNFDIEWWYLTANLESEDGEIYAFQWTLFRFTNVELNNDWHKGQTYMAHTSLHTPKEHWFEERFAAGGAGNAIVGIASANADTIKTSESDKPLVLRLDKWSWTAHNADGSLFPATLIASVTADDERHMSINFDLISSGDFVLQGDSGYSVKSAQGKHASHYYSLPFIDVRGSLQSTDGDGEIQLSGKAWYDHEWTSTLLDNTTAGWDWMSLHFDNGDKLMAFSMRLSNEQNYQTGTYITSKGEATTLHPEDISLRITQYTDADKRSLPLHWQVSIPKKSLDVSVTARRKKAYNPSIFGYYEGDLIVEGSHKGVGFLELTGY